ncbi:hypothetical protein TNCV_3102981 [Trichonephila clavipes]|nr:hypothetical protein TNCV_3102981 [Trichonephila clavipes]
MISCSFAAPVSLGSLDLLFFCRPCRSQLISSLAPWAPKSRCILAVWEKGSKSLTSQIRNSFPTIGEMSGIFPTSVGKGQGFRSN